MKVNRAEVIDASQRKLLFNPEEVWVYRELFYFFTWRDIKIKYRQTVLGFLWAVLQPLLMMVILSLFFGRALNLPSQNIRYPIFVFSGLLVWNIFSSGLSNASASMVNNALIIKKIYFPRLVIPVSAMMVALFDFLMAFILFIPLLLFFGQHVSVDALWMWPLSVALCLSATFGPGCMLAALNVKYRDFRYVIPFLIQVLFFLTPVLYPVKMLDNPLLQFVVIASPLYAPVELFRHPLTLVPLDVSGMLVSIGINILLLFCGLIYFRKTEAFFADFV
jgi:lipopolysaccharide transport system permease protein